MVVSFSAIVGGLLAIDEVRVWNYARTQAQLQAAMNTEFCGPQAGLMVYYKFNQGVAGGSNTGQTILDDASPLWKCTYKRTRSTLRRTPLC